ncbi:MAG: hypothetical protein HYU99_04115 [Deltaproteobacteria bacterium]|nr:hypothetical protein [Deltaproteobacteria bacterium]
MKKLSLFAPIFSALICIQLFLTQPVVYAETANPRVETKTMSRMEIIKILQNVEKQKGDSWFDYWDVVFATLTQMHPLLAQGMDKELCTEFFKFLAHFTSYGLDGEPAEVIPSDFVEIFWANPELIGETFKQYSDKPLQVPYDSPVSAKTEKQFLYQVLEAGWEDFLNDKNKNDPKVVELTKKLKALNPGPTSKP